MNKMYGSHMIVRHFHYREKAGKKINIDIREKSRNNGT